MIERKRFTRLSCFADLNYSNDCNTYLVNQHSAWFAALCRAYNTGAFQLIHDFAGAVEADRVSALQR
jgi:hypothetical protein